MFNCLLFYCCCQEVSFQSYFCYFSFCLAAFKTKVLPLVLQFYNDLSKYILLFIYPDWDSLGFLKLKIHALHQFWKVLTHYFFKYCLCFILCIFFFQNSIYKLFSSSIPFFLIFYIYKMYVFIFYIYYMWCIYILCVIYSFYIIVYWFFVYNNAWLV